jgi:hypothetical protein
MQLFQVLRSIETKNISVGTLNELISADSTYLLFRHEVRTLILIRGSKASLVTHLIGLKLANEYRKSLLRDYLLYEWDEKETLEKIGNVPVQAEGIVHELINIHLKIELDESGIPLPLNEYYGFQIQIPDLEWKSYLSLKKLHVFEEQKINPILDQIKTLPPIPDYHLEMVLIDNTIYIPFEETECFFLQTKYQQKYLKLGQLPEGRFFKEGYSSRLIIKNHRVQALIFYRPSNQQSEVSLIHAPVLEMENVTKVGDFNRLLTAFKIPAEKQK